MLRLAVRLQREQAELALAELLELAPGGVEERSVADDVIEYAVYGQPGELPALPVIVAAAGAGLVEVRTEEIADDWSERWRQFHRPLVLEGRLTVRPPWEPRGRTPIDVVIDPGQAFGTGSHATTKLCLELMLELNGGGPFMDLGCGSGVLAIVAAHLGFSPVLAIDNERASVLATLENAARNRVELHARRLDLRSDALPAAQTVAANLLAPLLRSWAGRLAYASTLPERVIASGILHHEVPDVLDAFAVHRFDPAARASAGGWTSLLLKRV